MRRIFVLLSTLAVCLVLAPAASAAPRGCEPAPQWFDFGLKGTVTAVDTAGGVLSVDVEHGTQGLPVSMRVLVDEGTRLLRAEHCDRTEIGLDDISAGDRVMIAGWTDESGDEVVYTAAVVAVEAPCFALVGTVTAVDVGEGLLTVSVDEASGDLTGEVEIVVTDETRVVRAHRFGSGRGCVGEEVQLTLSDIDVGDTVGVWGTVDDSGETSVYTADRVSVQVPRFGLVGSVTAVDVTGGVVSVEIDHASGDLTGTVDVTVTGDTELYRVAGNGKTDITLSDVAVGDEVAVFGTIDLSTGDDVYTAHVVLDGVSADWLPRPACRPGDASVAARHARKGDRLRLRLRIADGMPGCPSASVTLRIRSASGRTVAAGTVAGVKVNAVVTVGIRLGSSLHRGRYRVVATARDWAGNRQARARAAVLTVK
jgi:hypothetical protein